MTERRMSYKVGKAHYKTSTWQSCLLPGLGVVVPVDLGGDEHETFENYVGTLRRMNRVPAGVQRLW